MSRGARFYVTNPMYMATQEAATNVNVGNISITSKTTQSVHATSFQPVPATNWQPYYAHYGAMYPQAIAGSATPQHPGPVTPVQATDGHPSYYHPSPVAKENQHPPPSNSGDARALRSDPNDAHGQSTHIPRQAEPSVSATANPRDPADTAFLHPPPAQSKQPAPHSASPSANNSPEPQSMKSESSANFQQPPPMQSKQDIPTHSHSSSVNTFPYPLSTSSDSTAALQPPKASDRQATHSTMSQPSVLDSSYPHSINSVDLQPSPVTNVSTEDAHISPRSINNENGAAHPPPSSAHATGGLPYVPPPQKSTKGKDSLHPLRLLMQGGFSRLFKRSPKRRSHEVEPPNQEQKEETNLTLFEYPPQIEKEQLIEQEPEVDEPDGPDDANTLPSILEVEENKVTFIDCVGAIEPAGGQPSDSPLEDQQKYVELEEEQNIQPNEPKDICFPMRANNIPSQEGVIQSHSTSSGKTHADKPPEVPETVTPNGKDTERANEMCDIASVSNPTRPLTITNVNLTTESQSPYEQSVHVSKSETNKSEQAEDTDSPCKSVAVVVQAPLNQDESENQCTFIDIVEDSPPLAVEEIVEKIMPKEDREMYKAVIECMVPSDDKSCSCSCKTCFGSCCFSVSCDNPTKIHKGGTKTKSIMTEDLQKGAQNGWNIFKEVAFPTLRPFFRDLIAISEFLIGLLGLILSVISFSLGNNAGYNIFHIALAGLATILGLIDTITSLKYSAAFKEAWKKRKTRECCSRQAAENELNNNNDPTLTVDKEKEFVKNDSQKGGNDIHDSQEMSIVNIQNRNEPNWLKRGWDMGRLIIAELIFYPLLICDLIEFIVDNGYRFKAENSTDILGFFLVIHSFASQVFYVYILRLVVLIAMIVHIHKKRTLPQHKLDEAAALDNETNISDQKSDDDDKLNRDIASDGIKFQSYFVFHVAGQMAAQILMIVAISITIHKDNENKTLDDSLHISSRLWFMIVAGYVFPFIGIVSFFIPTFYWTYEHPNGICINLLSMLEAPGIGHVLMFDEDTKDVRSKVTEIAKHLNKDQLKEDFRKLRDQAFSNKLFYPFKSPLLVIVCLFYSFCQFAFLLTAILAIQSGDPGTVFFYVLSIVVGIIANIYVFAVAALWTTIIVGILVLIAVIIALLVLACVLLSCGRSKSSQQTRVY